MYFYTLSDGCYSSEYNVFLFHEKKFNKNEFIEMFNEAVKNGRKDPDKVSEYFIEKFGFSKMEEEFYVRCDYGEYREITEEDKSKAVRERNTIFFDL